MIHHIFPDMSSKSFVIEKIYDFDEFAENKEKSVLKFKPTFMYIGLLRIMNVFWTLYNFYFLSCWQCRDA